MPHPNEQLAREVNDSFGQGDMAAVLSFCHDDIVFHVPGKAPFGPPLDCQRRKDGRVA